MAAPTLVAADIVTTTTGATNVSASLSWQVGDVVAIVAGNEGSATGHSWSASVTTTGTGLSFTQQQVHSSNSDPGAACWTAVATATSSGTITLTQTGTTTDHTAAGFYIFRGSAGVGHTGLSTGSPRTVSVTSTSADSSFLWGVYDWAAVAVVAEAPTSTVHSSGSPGPTASPASLQVSPNYTYYVEELDDQTATGANTYGIGGSGTGPFTIVAIEILAGGASSPQPTVTAPAFGVRPGPAFQPQAAYDFSAAPAAAAVAAPRPIVRAVRAVRAGIATVLRSPSRANSTPQPKIVTSTARRAGRTIVGHGANILGNPAVATPLAHAARIVTTSPRRGTGRAIVAHGLMAAAVAAQAPAHQPQVHQTTARRAAVIQVHRSPNLADSTPQPHILSVSSRRPGRVIVWRTPGAVGNPAQPTPQPKVLAPSTRRPGRTIVVRSSVIGVPAVATPRPKIVSSSRRQPGRTIVTRPQGQLGVAAFAPHSAPPHVLAPSRRQPGRVIVVRTGGAVGIPAQPQAVPPLVRAPSRRRPGRVIVTRPEGMLGVAQFFPHAAQPLVVNPSTRRAGRVIVVHAGKLGNPAVSTPQPHVVATSRRQPGRVVVLGQHAAAPVIPLPAHQPLVHQTNARRAAVIRVVRTPGALGIAAQPHSRGPIVRLTNRRQAGRTIIRRTSLPPPAFSVGRLHSTDAGQTTVQAGEGLVYEPDNYGIGDYGAGPYGFGPTLVYGPLTGNPVVAPQSALAAIEDIFYLGDRYGTGLYGAYPYSRGPVAVFGNVNATAADSPQSTLTGGTA